jgi:hypothetical protein
MAGTHLQGLRSVKLNPATQRHVPEVLNPQQHRCENLKSHKIFSILLKSYNFIISPMKGNAIMFFSYTHTKTITSHRCNTALMLYLEFFAHSKQFNQFFQYFLFSNSIFETYIYRRRVRNKGRSESWKTTSLMMWYCAQARVDRLSCCVDPCCDCTHKLMIVYTGISLVQSEWVAELKCCRGIIPMTVRGLFQGFCKYNWSALSKCWVSHLAACLIYIYIYIYLYLFIHTHKYIPTRTYIHTYVYVCVLSKEYSANQFRTVI